MGTRPVRGSGDTHTTLLSTRAKSALCKKIIRYVPFFPILRKYRHILPGRTRLTNTYNMRKMATPERTTDTEYLCIDDFLRTLVDARALRSALDIGLIDQLQAGATDADRLEKSLGCDSAGLGLLLDLLAGNRVVDLGPVRLTDSFRAAVRFRDLLEAKLDFANFVAPDFLNSFTLLLTEPRRFQERTALFDLFDYRRCLDVTPENLDRTRRWMRFTTCLTRYEAPVCIARHDFAAHQRVLDIGGNSGEFALQICKRHPAVSATVFDLPVVCAVGREHVAKEPEAPRIAFMPGNALGDPLPTGFDLVLFKSMLHDWPDLEAKRLQTRASNCLKPGGTLLIFERGPLQPAQSVPYSLLPMLLFFRSFRASSFYEEHLTTLGFREVTTQVIQLDMPFWLITARLGKRD